MTEAEKARVRKLRLEGAGYTQIASELKLSINTCLLYTSTLILQNDKMLKAIVFNQQLDGMEIKGTVPWKHPSKYWRDCLLYTSNSLDDIMDELQNGGLTVGELQRCAENICRFIMKSPAFLRSAGVSLSLIHIYNSVCSIAL